MKTLHYILLVTGLLVSSLTMNYLAAQEYDDLYYDPKTDTKSQKDQQEPQREKSDYEKYIESLEQQADNTKADSINKAKSSTEYNDDLDYVGSEEVSNNRQTTDDNDKNYDNCDCDYETHFRRFNSYCYSCNYYDDYWYDWDWSFRFSFGYPFWGGV
jgi:hypothetical protein